MIEKRAPAIYIVSLCTFAQYGISYLTFIIMTAIMPEMNFINIFLSIFGLSDFIYKDTFSHLFIYIIASIQIVFTYFLLGREVRKLGFEVNLDINYKWVMFLISMILIVISIIMYFVYTPLLYVFMVANLPLVIYQVINVISYKKKINYVFLVISLFIGVGLFAGLYSLIPHPKSIILFSIMFFLFSLIYFVNYLFMNKTKIAKIDY